MIIKTDKRAFFVVGDLVTNVVAGVLVAWLVWSLVDTSWNMFIAMIIMMFVGMIISFIIYIPGAIFFGAMEVMVPIMLTGMLSGMVISMWAAMEPLRLLAALDIGALSGLVSLLVVWVLNSRIGGIQKEV